jgi:hypothetical protein
MHSLNIISINMQCSINDGEYSRNSEVNGAGSKFRAIENINRSNKNLIVDMAARK